MTSINDSHEILIVAAESSSALYAQRLLEHWQKSKQSVKAFGIGSRDMENLGFEIIGRAEDLAVVGLQEVISHWPVIRNAFHGLIEAAKVRKPKVALLLDYPDFNLRLAKKLKALGIQVVYYISPQVWAWRQSRVKTIRKVVDRMLVLFPFEKDFYEKHNVPVDFVGHPLLDELKPDLFDSKQVQILRSRYGVVEGELVLGLMPGSRRSEIRHHLLVQLQAAEILRQEFKNLKVIILVAPQFSVSEFKTFLPQTDVSAILVQDEPFRMIGLTDVVLCASGTATLMVGLLNKPMVIMYRMNAFSAWVAKTFVKSTEFFGLINLVIGKRVVPERFQEEAAPALLAEELRVWLSEENSRRAVSNELEKAKQRLGERGATLRVAKIVESMW